jgi:hypothetical protein
VAPRDAAETRPNDAFWARASARKALSSGKRHCHVIVHHSIWAFVRGKGVQKRPRHTGVSVVSSGGEEGPDLIL